MLRIRRLAYKLLPPNAIGIASALFARPRKSYATFGEDVVAQRLLLELIGNRRGTYVDIGAFHPVYGSNTKLLYEAGWRGLNVEADPHKVATFRLFRPRDVNVCAVVAAEERETEFYFHAGAKYGSMAGLDRGGVEHSAESMGREIASRRVRTRTLESILVEHDLRSADFLNIDIEGSEADILRSVDLGRYAVKLIACEIRGTNLDEIAASDATRLLKDRGFSIAAWTPPTVFFQSNGSRSRYGKQQDGVDRVW